MKDGVLQQLDTPDRVYHYPANLFVADFIGSPKVNLIDASASPAEGCTRLRFADFELRGPAVDARGAVVAAIRPEDLCLSLEPRGDAVEFVTYSVLPAGPEVIVNVRRGDLMLTVKEDRGLQVDMDHPVWLTVDPACINLYDKETTRLIGPAA
jgi:multiple sugar transport system ATP-binding protein